MKYIVSFFICMVFVFSGCAHQPVVSTSGKIPISEENIVSPETDSASADKKDEKIEDDLDLWDQGGRKEEIITVADPFAPWNRIMFRFNDKLYLRVLKPVAEEYKSVTPTPMRVGVRNFFDNLTAPIRVVNCLLQGKIFSAEMELTRFLINSTAGILGIRDAAAKMFLFPKPSEEDLGQTLGTYGIGNGCYIVWPILGPSTLRDSVGTFGDRFLNPIAHIDLSPGGVIGVTAFETVNETSFRIGDYEAIKDAAIEPYEAFRDAYLQYRKNKIRDSRDEKNERRYDSLIKEWIK
jgi:phospholipid-binding lipoprotein MlaA